ncbi:hypothetical protein DKK73_05150 [Bifidobacterium asteroides]|uniref:XRE family transcriptional regulator n=1 Tax=Bifidobacterium polysaccharolyticum TaxID=2750967 RepID=A0ABS0QX57_9BIFI|nr:hypothetical protein [Bifidobacterium polysaccharolyticum]MBI0106196.1 hypothetical protein [Bifidobacterium polysaccharolyticum]PXY83593.1 hypothetical protein DKK73_05150 [Bifidobacterium asteroides]
MSDKSTYWYDLADSVAHEDLKNIADQNAESFYELKRDLVRKRESLCSIEQIAEQLGEPVDTVAEFEQYYSDPTVSQLQEYALAVMCLIKIKAVDFEPNKKRMFSRNTVSVDPSESIGNVLRTNTSEAGAQSVFRKEMTI